MERQIRLLVADDHKLFAEGLTRLLGDEPDIDVVGVAHDGEDAVALALRLRPDVILMDLVMPRCSGVDATRRVLAHLPNVRIIASADREDDRQFVASIRAGAYGFVTKTSPVEVLIKCIRGAANGEPAISRAQVRLLLSQLGRPSAEAVVDRKVCPLSRRERDVLELLVEGKTYGTIAAALCITEHTVRSHVQNMQEKLGLPNRAQLIGYAVANRLFDPQGEIDDATAPPADATGWHQDPPAPVEAGRLAPVAGSGPSVTAPSVTAPSRWLQVLNGWRRAPAGTAAIVGLTLLASWATSQVA